MFAIITDDPINIILVEPEDSGCFYCGGDLGDAGIHPHCELKEWWIESGKCADCWAIQAGILNAPHAQGCPFTAV